MTKIPENFFEPHTEPFVVLRYFPMGTTKFGYGSTATEALRASEVAELGQGTVTVYRRTEGTKMMRGTLWQIYEDITARVPENSALS